MQAIRVEKLVKEYGKHRAVNSVSFAVEEGECFGLLGTNGAGKSTLLNIVAGLLSPTSGHVHVLGKDVEKDWREVKRVMGHCFGFSSYMGNLTGRESLRVVGYAHGMSDRQIEARVDELAEIVALDAVDRKQSEYSSGMTQKLSLMVALLHDPQVLLVDELTVGLDVEAAKRIRQVLSSLKGEKTIVLTTHYMAEADLLCDRIGLMNNGALVALETPLQLKRRVRDYDLLELETSDDEKARRVASKLCCVEADKLVCQVKGQQVAELLSALVREGVVVKKVRLREPSLEEVFDKMGDFAWA
jgi:ABC-2 type transport system ATP-binding protein